jgi:hypothetical protein
MVMRRICLTLMLGTIVATQADAAALFRSAGRDNSTKPSAPAKPTPAPVVTAPPTPLQPTNPVTVNPNSFLDIDDIFYEIARPVGDRVDSRYSSYRSLLEIRHKTMDSVVDSCHAETNGRDTFMERISFYVHEHTKDITAHVAHLASYYGLPTTVAATKGVSLSSHKLCTHTTSSLTHTIGSNRVPAQATITKINQFSNMHNGYLDTMSKGTAAQKKDAEVKLNQLWSKFMGCLAYQESLTTADTTTSKNVSAKYSPSSYRKPAGVKFYEDALQPEASRLNIGLFQFTPTASGNVNACLRHWNHLYPKCGVKTNATRAELIHAFGSNFQSMNAFCGVNKVIQTFTVQANTNKTSGTHPSNVTSGKFKAAGERCVTPFFLAGRAYNHFGPFQNSTGKNLDALLTCTLN